MTLAAVIGAGVGLVLGVVDFVILGTARHRIAERPERGGFAAIAFEAARVSQLILFPVVGWFAGPFIASALGG